MTFVKKPKRMALGYSLPRREKRSELVHSADITAFCIHPANLAWLAEQGITLENYFAQTHPSEPNYVASHGGDYFGMDNDEFNFIDANISTIVDLLENKGISWGEYQEDMPYTGFEGFAWVNQETGANDCEYRCLFKRQDSQLT